MGYEMEPRISMHYRCITMAALVFGNKVSNLVAEERKQYFYSDPHLEFQTEHRISLTKLFLVFLGLLRQWYPNGALK